MENIKQNLTLQQKRFRAAVDYSSCICKSGGEAARGSLPALSPYSDQAISKEPATAGNQRSPGPGHKQQTSSNKQQAGEAQASSYKDSSNK